MPEVFRRTVFRPLMFVLLFVAAGCFSPSATEPESSARAGSSAWATRLAVGDAVELTVYREPQLSGQFRVDASGHVRHMLCGPVHVAGMTGPEAEEAFRSILAEKYLVNPRVSLAVVESQSEQIAVLGEVKEPGMLPLPYGSRITLVQAIAMAGGFTELASPNRVTVQRQDHQEPLIRVHIPRVLSGEDEDLVLRPNDVIMVPQIRF